MSQFKIASMTVHDQSAVRRVLRDYKRAQELWVKIKARPSHLAAGFQEVAETNEDHEIEIFFPVPQMSDALYAQLVGDRELGEEAKGNLLEVRRCAEAFEAIEDMEAWFGEGIRALAELIADACTSGGSTK